MGLRKLIGSRSRERGSLIIEMALAMPVFLFLVAGALDLGMLFWVKHIVTNAAREGARAAVKSVAGDGATPNLTQSGVQTVVQNYLNQYAFKNLDGTTLNLNSTTFTCTWTAPPDRILTVSLNQIPCKMNLIPNVKTMFGGTRASGDDAFYLSAQTSMAAQWTTPPGP